MGNPFDVLRARLAARVAMTAAVVTACGGETGSSANDGGGGAHGGAGGSSGGSAGTSGAGGSAGFDAAALPPLPDPDSGAMQCDSVAYDAGSYALAGPCCPEVACFTPASGQPCPTGATDLASTLFPGRGFGSGECLCGIDGPYQGNAENACCYVASIQWCTGRTLWVGGTPLVAPLVDERWV